jgi:hypothetical protein
MMTVLDYYKRWVSIPVLVCHGKKGGGEEEEEERISKMCSEHWTEDSD